MAAARRRRASLGSRRPAPAAALLLQQTPSPFLHCNGLLPMIGFRGSADSAGEVTTPGHWSAIAVQYC
uniref:Uncharacterized protein n=1 Tax=Oryza glumipatula TaxID=40148 RepID=A0A0E0AB78_9ORYZ